MVIALDAFSSFTLAILLLFVGKAMLARAGALRRYGIPEPVIGGLLCAAAVCTLYYGAGIEVAFTLDLRDTLLLYFFGALGLNSNVRMLFSGGRLLVILLALATAFIVMQNALGMALATAFGLDARAGLMVGSVSLTGGVGTTLAWAPHFEQALGIPLAGELGLAANMVGLVAACVVGGPVAGWLIRRHRITPSHDRQLEVGTLHGEKRHSKMDHYSVLLAVFWLNLALMLGSALNALVARNGLKLPDFVGCLLAGIVLRALGDFLAPHGERLWGQQDMKAGLALLSDISLGLFLTMALMGLRLWELAPVLPFITTVMVLQILMALLFTVLVVFRVMGRDYEAAVVCSAFGGIALGSTATAVANMSAVTQQYGAAPRAFLIVPLVCGFFIDLVNALVVGWMAG